jgi:hypothetical protein
MWSLGVVVDAPGAENRAGERQVCEQSLVQQLVTQSAVESLDEGILLRFAWAM